MGPADNEDLEVEDTHIVVLTMLDVGPDLAVGPDDHNLLPESSKQRNILTSARMNRITVFTAFPKSNEEILVGKQRAPHTTWCTEVRMPRARGVYIL